MTKADLLTFFQPGGDPGTAWTFSCSSAPAPRSAWAYVPREVDLSQFVNWEVSSQEQFNQLLAETREEVQKHGGILVEASVHNNVIRLTLFSGNGAPRKILRLRPAGDPQFESFSNSVDLEAGEHLIFPVSVAAQQKLETFEDVCEGFPADLRSSLFNVIRRPSLEWRIQRIEEMLSLEPPTQAERQRSHQHQATFLEKLSRWFLWPIPAGWVAAAVLLLLGTFVAYKLWPGDAAVIEETNTPAAETEQGTVPVDVPPATLPDKPAVDPGPSPIAPASTASANGEQPLDDLFQALAGSPETSTTGKIYKSHFKPWTGKELKYPSPSVWGIAKLEALRLNIVPDSETLQKTDERSFLKEALQDQEKGKPLTDDKSASAMLAWVCCQRYGMPALVAGRDDKEPFLFKGYDCKTLEPGDAIPGLDALTTWVTNQNLNQAKAAK